MKENPVHVPISFVLSPSHISNIHEREKLVLTSCIVFFFFFVVVAVVAAVVASAVAVFAVAVVVVLHLDAVLHPRHRLDCYFRPNPRRCLEHLHRCLTADSNLSNFE